MTMFTDACVLEYDNFYICGDSTVFCTIFSSFTLFMILTLFNLYNTRQNLFDFCFVSGTITLLNIGFKICCSNAVYSAAYFYEL